jgi:steroid 5-alpha reductase family enzyme
MNDFLTFLFWPNPGNADYTSPKALLLLVLCIAAVVTSFVLPRLRARWQDPQLKKVSGSWAAACGWFGWSGLLLVIARVEEIQYLGMRFLWVIWGAALAAYLALQVRVYRNRYYEVIPNRPTQDARAQYLPKRKKR